MGKEQKRRPSSSELGQSLPHAQMALYMRVVASESWRQNRGVGIAASHSKRTMALMPSEDIHGA